MSASFLRPSMLPKLAQCGHFRSDPISGEAAQRGTLLDTAFRALLEGDSAPLMALDSEDAEAVQWAVKTVRMLAAGDALCSKEAELKLTIPGFENGGTMDVACWPCLWSGDLKSGQIYDYRPQMAAYALGCMEREFADEWTTYLLFCDQQVVETHRWTYESATEAIDEALALYLGGVPPQTNGYCSWCANRWTCDARKEELGNKAEFLLVEADPKTGMQGATSATLAKFVGWSKVVEDWAEEAKAILKHRGLEEKQPPPTGVKFVPKQGRKQLSRLALERDLKTLGTQRIFAAYGDLSESKARAVYESAGLPFPEADLIQLPGWTEIHIKKPAETFKALKPARAKAE